jgi:hypothetical protein
LRLERQYRGRIVVAVAKSVGRRSETLSESEAWFVGIDWASEAHQVCLVDAEGEVVGEHVAAHSGEGLVALCAWLERTSGAELSAMRVAIETTHGAVVDTLLERGAQVFAVNPKQLDRFRDRFTVAGAKDDRRDAFVLARSLRTDADCFRALEADEPTVIELREWSRMADDLEQERNRLGNRLREQLRRYYPQMLEITDDVAANWFLDVWQQVPTPANAAGVRKATIAGLLKRHRIRRISAERVLSTLRQRPLKLRPGAAEAATAHVGQLVARLRLVNRQRKEAHKQLDKLCERLAELPLALEREHRDVEILRSLPGIGRINLATLLAEASQPLAVRDYHALRALSGAAPVTRATGKRSRNHATVVMRRACNLRIRNAVYHWARVSTQKDPRSRAHYAALRGRGHSHARALRGVGDRLLALACAMLRDGTLYDAERRQVAA